MLDLDPEPQHPRNTRVIVGGLLIAFAWVLAPAVPIIVAWLLPHAATCAQLGDALSVSAVCAGIATVLVMRVFLHR